MVQPLITRALRPGHALPAPLARMYRCTRKDSPQPDPAPAQHAPSQLDHFLTRRPSSPDRCVTAILKPRRPPSPTPSGPTPLCPTPPPAATRPLLSRGTRPARGPRPHLRATIRPPPSVGLLTPPPPPPGRCRQHRLMRASPLRRVVTVGPCLYRVLYVRVACVRPRRVRARDNVYSLYP